MQTSRTRVGIDTGGTFTDFVVYRNGRIEVFKKFSTPHQPEAAIFEGLNGIAATDIVHGSTVATNALLEREGARVALLTTEGFEDVLAIGRQARPELYNIFVRRPEPLVPEALRFAVKERILFDGKVARPLDAAELRRLVDLLRVTDVEAIAVCLLFSFANSVHEDMIQRALTPLDMPVSLSSRVLPEYREFERTSTTVVNAYLAPKMGQYLTRLGTALQGVSLRVIQSNGGAVSAAAAATSPVTTIVSGPAGGVVGAFHVADLSGYTSLMTFDMGGTSTDVSLCAGSVGITHEAQIDGMPVGIPMIDIHTVGAGGGSIAELDCGGSLQVGPASAGAVPGPICYGKGGKQLTVTDANVLLGRLPPRFFLGGTARLAAEEIPQAMRKLSWTNAWKSAEALAQGIIDVVNNNMEQALRLISVERGHDPRDFTLVSFGGAGGLHAADLARSLGVARVLVPMMPGALSALGLLLADAQRDFSRSLLIPLEGSRNRLRDAFAKLHDTGSTAMKAEGFDNRRVRHADFVDLRYFGQSYDLTVSAAGDLARQFHRLHESRYGYADPSRPVEVVSVRTTFSGRVPKIRFEKQRKVRGRAQELETTTAWFFGRRYRTAIYDRGRLSYGHIVHGPAIVGEYSATTVVPPDFVCKVDPYGNLLLLRQAARAISAWTRRRARASDNKEGGGRGLPG